jgi:aminopeptidase N
MIFIKAEQMVARVFATVTLLVMWVLSVSSLCAQQIDYRLWPVREERSREFDAIHYRVELRFNVEDKSFEGKSTMTLSPLRDGFQRCDLDAEVLKVRKASIASTRSLSFAQVGGSISISLDRSYDAGDTLDVTIEYSWKQGPANNEAFGMSPGYDISLRFLDETADHPALIQTLSFPTGARHWFPCYDHPNDKATYEFIATVPDSYSVLANGRLVSIGHDPQGGGTTYHWSQELPHSTYLTVLTAGPYAVLRDSLESLPISYWVYAKDAANAWRSFRKTPEIIDFFASMYDVSYPWVKYDQITVPGIGGGSESTSATILGQSTIHDERADQDFPSHWLVAHEAAHQWWGDLVTLRDWGHTWINEAFATYGEYLYSRYSLGNDEGSVNLLEKKNAYLREANTRFKRPIVLDRWRFPNDNFDRHTYQKGAAVLHMLRSILGDDDYSKVNTTFLRKHAFGSADTHDFQIAVEEVTGQDFSWFFDQWLYRPGHPVLEISAEWDATEELLRMRVRQLQDTSGGIPVFKLPVVIGITNRETVTSHTVWVDNREEVFTFACAEEPLLVRFDRGNTLLKEWSFTKSTSELLYQLGYDDVVGRMWSAGELSGRLDEPGVKQALRQSALEDPFWAVRRSAIRAHSSQGGGTELEELLTICVQDTNSKVRVAAISALGDLHKPELTALFVEQLKNDDSYLVQAEAVRSIGKSRDGSMREILLSASGMHSPRNVIRSAALWALEQLPAAKKTD